jgi:predicted outer membrane repeat protein
MLKLYRALRATSPGTAGRRRRFFPRLETLETRAVPAVFTVTTTLDVVADDGKLSLREAISAANAHPGPDTILLPPGVYRLARQMADDTNAAGDFDVTDSTLFQGAGAGATVIDGQQIDRVFDVRGTAPGSIRVTFQGLTIRNGLADAGGGGGIRVGDADLLVQDCVITGNRTAGAGGGISNAARSGTGNVMVVRSVIDRNVAALGGGGLYVAANARNQGSVLNISGSTIRRNLGAQGGGIRAFQANLTGSVVSGNTAGDLGGGIDAVTANLTNSNVSGNLSGFSGGGIQADTANLTGSVVNRNTASEFGGGIDADTMKLANSTVSGNHADVGGGLVGVAATLTDSTVSGSTANDDGGGLIVTTATLLRSNVSANSARLDGGGIFATTAKLTDSTVGGNHASRNGGGINATTATLTRCTANGNTAGGNGGGMLVTGTATLTNSTVGGNSAGGDGGGIATLTGTIVVGNSAEQVGGIVTLTGSTVSGNTAVFDGGGIAAVGASLTNSTVSGNTAGRTGGGAFTALGLTLLNVTVTDNSAHTGGGVFAQGGGASARNSIIAGNLVDFSGTCPDVSSAFTSGGHNLIGDGGGSTGFINGANGDQVGTAANPIDPRLAPLAHNGGPTRTHALPPGSPAIDRGDNAGAPATDQRGARRARDGDGNGNKVVDIGAFER